MVGFRAFCVVLLGVLCLFGCAEKRSPVAPNPGYPSWHSVSVDATSPYSVSLAQVSDKELRVEVRNTSRKNFTISTYYFGYVIEVEYGSEKARFDYGADKVPIQTVHDWHVLRPGQSISWSLLLPSSFRPLKDATAISYFCSSTDGVPAHIAKDPEAGPCVKVSGRWKR